MVRRGEDVAPVLLAGIIDDGKVRVVAADGIPALTSGEEKIAVTVMMAKTVQRDDVDFVVFITEVWIALRSVPSGTHDCRPPAASGSGALQHDVERLPDHCRKSVAPERAVAETWRRRFQCRSSRPYGARAETRN